MKILVSIISILSLIVFGAIVYFDYKESLKENEDNNHSGGGGGGDVEAPTKPTTPAEK